MPQLPRRTGPPSHRTRQAARSAAHTSGAVGSGCPVPCVVCVCVCVCVCVVCVCRVCVVCVSCGAVHSTRAPTGKGTDTGTTNNTGWETEREGGGREKRVSPGRRQDTQALGSPQPFESARQVQQHRQMGVRQTGRQTRQEAWVA